MSAPTYKQRVKEYQDEGIIELSIESNTNFIGECDVEVDVEFVYSNMHVTFTKSGHDYDAIMEQINRAICAIVDGEDQHK